MFTMTMSSWKGLFSEIELLLQHGITCVGRLHVLADFGDGDVKVQVEAENGTSDQHDENGESGVFKIRHLDLHRSKFDSPSGIFVVGRWFESHMLPVRGLKILEMVGLVQIESLQILVEYDDWIPDEEMRKMCC